MSKDTNENKTPPPVELTDEQMEQASGGNQAERDWKQSAEADGRTDGPHLHNVQHCHQNAVYGTSWSKIDGNLYNLDSAYCYNCKVILNGYTKTFG